jgi:hypothetical protein
MDLDHITYKQLDDLLSDLGFVRSHVEPKWLRYEHAPSDSLIVLAEKKPQDLVRITDAVSARLHLVAKGLISEEELKAFLSRSSVARKAVSAKHS